MRRATTSFLFIIFFLSLSLAQEAPKYNFGTMQQGKNFYLHPGEEFEIPIYFYNVYGNRITHVIITPENVPEGWEVEINPEVHNQTLIVSGIRTTIQENIYVEPTNATGDLSSCQEIISRFDSPGKCLWNDNIKSYIPAKEVRIRVKVPENETLGSVHTLSVMARARWYDITGGISFSQERRFNYRIMVISESYYEYIVRTFDLGAFFVVHKWEIISVVSLGLLSLLGFVTYRLYKKVKSLESQKPRKGGR